MSHCNPELLWTLVEQSQEPTTHDAGLFAHIAACDACQRTLESVAADESWWSDSRDWLRESHRSRSVQGEDGSAECDINSVPDLSFLSMAPHPELLGRLGRYDIEGYVGHGGMGVVLRGFDPDLQRTVAIKVLAPPWSRDSAARQRFAREAQAAASIAHENVVPIYHVQAEHEPPFLVMRYISGTTLESYLRKQGTLRPETILRIAGQLVDGLAAAHEQGLVHRDVKPSNVLIGEEVERIWVTDFGLARAAGDATLTHSGMIAGTPHFMSPEQARGEAVDSRSDWFSLGSLLFFLCAGRSPFTADSTLAVLHQVVNAPAPNLHRLRNDLPEALVSLVERLLRKRPAARPASSHEIRGWLKQATEQLAEGQVGCKPLVKRPGFIAAALLAVAVMGIVGYRAVQNDHVDAVEVTNESEASTAASSGQGTMPFSAFSSATGGGDGAVTAFGILREAQERDSRLQSGFQYVTSELKRLEESPLRLSIPIQSDQARVDRETTAIRQQLDTITTQLKAMR